jgi:hypothetical protein
MNRSTTNDGLLVATLAQPANLSLSMSQPALAKLPLSFWLGCGIVFNFQIESGHAVSSIACQCGHWSSRRVMK